MTTRTIPKPAACVLVTLALSAGAAACGDSGKEGRPGVARQEPPTAPPPLEGEKAKVATAPSVIANQFGTVSTAAYDAIARRSTADHPYGPLAGGGSYPNIGRTKMIRTSGAAVVAEVLSISRPHFNTDDGGVRIHPDGGVDGGPIQVVRLRILERWADRLGLPDVFDVVVFGGQLEFFLTDEQARAARLTKGGRYITGQEPSVDLALGERALLIITKVDIGWVGGRRQALIVRHDGKFPVVGDRVAGTSVPEFRDEIRRELGADCPDGPAAGRCPT